MLAHDFQKLFSATTPWKIADASQAKAPRPFCCRKDTSSVSGPGTSTTKQKSEVPAASAAVAAPGTKCGAWGPPSTAQPHGSPSGSAWSTLPAAQLFLQPAYSAFFSKQLKPPRLQHRVCLQSSPSHEHPVAAGGDAAAPASTDAAAAGTRGGAASHPGDWTAAGAAAGRAGVTAGGGAAAPDSRAQDQGTGIGSASAGSMPATHAALHPAQYAFFS
mmetsp:Transcript_71863/g.202907  ORF Transcript_71863/g.202907 Transcript_71863/m.202907 type:complete len:217 (-) Transcript_71863:147-797(-)